MAAMRASYSARGILSILFATMTMFFCARAGASAFRGRSLTARRSRRARAPRGVERVRNQKDTTNLIFAGFREFARELSRTRILAGRADKICC